MNVRKLLSWLPFKRFRDPPPVVAVVPLKGVIGRLGPWQRGLTLAAVAPQLQRAFKLPSLAAIALAVNSPGGAPVQAAQITRRIRALAEEHQVKVFAFAEDVAASGGYWLLTAADEIYADESSLIGSIGVVTAGFGFPEFLKRFGIERRVYVSGEHKAGLDPFQPEREEEVAHLRRIQADIHEAFRAHVRAHRQGKLKGSEDELFSGRFWGGRAALDLGLIDGIADLRTLMRERYGERVQLLVVADGRRWWQRRLGLGRFSLGQQRSPTRPAAAEGMAAGMLAALDEHLLWQRYRL
jgi:signal peptide peptidase SppA